MEFATLSRCLMHRLIVILLVLSGATSPAGGQPTTENAEPVLALRDNVIAIETTWRDGTVHDGFGFITGARGNETYVATAGHVLRGDEPGQIAETVALRLRQIPGRIYPGKVLETHEPGIDLAVLAAQLPPELDWRRDSIAQRPTELTFGVPVWFIGRDREWYVPAEPGVVNRISQLRYEIAVDHLGVRAGSSGAPLVSADGIVGMLVRDAASDTATATLITAIELAFREWGLPWALVPVGSLPELQSPLAAQEQLRPGDSDPDRQISETVGTAGEITDCDRLAGNPDDPHAVGPGVDFVNIDPGPATVACKEAVQRFPGVARYEYQYGRALHAADRAGEALMWLRRAAEKEYTLAWYALGQMHATGTGTAKDEASAVTWYRRAADRGYAPAQARLGEMYAQGLGAARDDGEAVHWLRKAAEQGDPRGQAWLGAMYAQGFGVANDDGQALEWFLKAADQNDAYGQAWLGYMYSEGRGTQRDLAEAERWLRKAQEQGYAWAADTLKRVLSEQELSRMQFAEARVENEFFIFEEDDVRQPAGYIDADFVLYPKRDIKVLLANDWLAVDDERGNRYELHKIHRATYFEACEYESNACLEKDFKIYKGGEPVNFSFWINIVNRPQFDENRPKYFKFLFKFLVWRPDGNLVLPVAIKVPLRPR